MLYGRCCITQQQKTEPVREWNKTDLELYRSRKILVSSVRLEPSEHGSRRTVNGHKPQPRIILNH